MSKWAFVRGLLAGLQRAATARLRPMTVGLSGNSEPSPRAQDGRARFAAPAAEPAFSALTAPGSRAHARERSARTLWLRADAPALPTSGQPCNGCGVCCALEPCPLGMWASRRRRGRCRLLRWDTTAGTYRCGALLKANALAWPWARPLARRLVARWIGAGVGCDADLTRAQ